MEAPWGGGGLGDVGLAAAMGRICSVGGLCVPGRPLTTCPPHQHGMINTVSSKILPLWISGKGETIYRHSKEDKWLPGVLEKGGRNRSSTGDFGGSEPVLSDTADTGHYTYMKTHGMHSTKCEP